MMQIKNKKNITLKILIVSFILNIFQPLLYFQIKAQNEEKLYWDLVDHLNMENMHSMKFIELFINGDHQKLNRLFRLILNNIVQSAEEPIKYTVKESDLYKNLDLEGIYRNSEEAKKLLEKINETSVSERK